MLPCSEVGTTGVAGAQWELWSAGGIVSGWMSEDSPHSRQAWLHSSET